MSSRPSFTKGRRLSGALMAVPELMPLCPFPLEKISRKEVFAPAERAKPVPRPWPSLSDPYLRDIANLDCGLRPHRRTCLPCPAQAGWKPVKGAGSPIRPTMIPRRRSG